MDKNKYLLFAVVILAIGVIAYNFKVEKKSSKEQMPVSQTPIVSRAKFELKKEVKPKEYAQTGINNQSIEKTNIAFQNKKYSIEIVLNSDGREKLKQLTQEYEGKSLAIFIDDKNISIAVVKETITDGTLIISGDYSQEQAENLRQRLTP